MLHISDEDRSFLKTINCFPYDEICEMPTQTYYGINMFLPVKDGRKNEYTIWNQTILDKIISTLKCQKDKDLINQIMTERVDNLWEINEHCIRNPYTKTDKKTNTTYIVSPIREQFQRVYKYLIVEENDNFIYHMQQLNGDFGEGQWARETSYKNKNYLNKRLHKMIDHEIKSKNEIINTLKKLQESINTTET